MNDFNLLFVCTGNTCRSPMAEVYFRHLCEQGGLDRISVTSAGIHAMTGCDASELAKKAIMLEGLSLHNFETTQIDEHLVQQASIIVGMTADHVQQITTLYPQVNDKTHVLMNFSGSREDIRDPFGRNFSKFRECLNTMKPPLHDLLDHIRSLL